MIDRDKYWDVIAINNSSLNYIDPESGGSPRYFKKYLDGLLQDKPSASFELGSLVHQVLLEPESIDIEPANVPGPKVKDIIDYLYLRLKSQHNGLMEFIELSAVDVEEWRIVIPDDYYSNRTLESKVDSILKVANPYWEALCLTQDKTIVDSDTFHKILGCVDSIRMHPFAADLIEGTGFGHSYQEAYNEIEIYFDKDWEIHTTTDKINLEFKAKLDRILINHEEKYYSLVDLKTTGGAIGMFDDTVFKYKYHRQLAFYQWAMSQAYEGYTCKSVFIVAVQTNKEYPCEVFTLDEDYLELGWIEASQLISRIAFHKHMNNWGSSMESLIGGVITLKLDAEDD